MRCGQRPASKERHEDRRDPVADVLAGDVSRDDVRHRQVVLTGEGQRIDLAVGCVRFIFEEARPDIAAQHEAVPIAEAKTMYRRRRRTGETICAHHDLPGRAGDPLPCGSRDACAPQLDRQSRGGPVVGMARSRSRPRLLHRRPNDSPRSTIRSLRRGRLLVGRCGGRGRRGGGLRLGDRVLERVQRGGVDDPGGSTPSAVWNSDSASVSSGVHFPSTGPVQ